MTADHLRYSILNGSDEQTECYFWFEDYFKFAGDHMPNSKEIHLDNQPLFRLYNMYKTECLGESVDYTRWRSIWNDLFPHVKMRVFKSVSGKCLTCGMLTGLRSQFIHPELKKMATELHALHRNTYMAEREAYYNRRKESIDFPNEIMSVISDGMAQTHTSLPYFANQAQNVAQLQQKVQGVLDHGRNKFSMYLCMHSCPSSTNLAIHTFYLQLEEWRFEKKRYPRKVYWQIDGGSENANTSILAFCEYLVSQTPVEEVVLTRLPVGHTHEDIDARFGTIWDHCKLRYSMHSVFYIYV